MKKVSFNEGTLGFDKNKVTYEVPLEKTNIQSIEEVQSIRNNPFTFPITRLDLIGNKTFLMDIEVENGYLPLGIFKSNSTDEEKYQFIKNLCEIAINLKKSEKLVTVFDDKNILVNPTDQEIKLLYCGIKGLMPAASYEIEDIETQIKRLALFILTTAKYDELRVNGLDIAISKTSPERYKVISRVLNSLTINDIFALFDELFKLLGQQEIMELRELALKELKKPKFLLKIPSIKISTNIKGKKNITVKEKSVKSSQDTNKKKTLFNGPRIKLIAGTIIAAVLIIFVISIFIPGKNTNRSMTFANSRSDEDVMIKGLQYASIQDYKHAANNFDKLKTPFGKISKENKRAVLFSYLMTGKYQKAINIEPKFSYSVINYLISTNHLEAVKKIDSKEPVIVFEKAAIKKDYKTLLKYKDDVELDGRRESLLVDAYIALNKLDEGIDFAKSKGNQDLINKIEALKTSKLQEQNNQHNQTESGVIPTMVDGVKTI